MDLASPPLTLLPDARDGAAVAVHRRACGVDLATVSDLADFTALRTEWTTLFEACGGPHQVFQTFEWLALWASLYLDRSSRLAVVTGRVDGRLVLAWPLVVRRICGVRVLTGMGAPLGQYTDALVAAEAAGAADAAFDLAMALPVDIVALRRLRDDAALAPMLRRRASPTHRQEAPFLDFAETPSAAAFEARFPGKLRSNRRRRWRRLEERGAVTFEHQDAAPEAVPLVEAAMEFKRDWARHAGVASPTLRDSRFARFFAQACRAGTDAPALRISVLRCGPEIAGIEISVACKGALCGHVLAPNPAFADFGVGGLLAERTIVSALEQGYSGIDLLAPADTYKREWTSACVGVADYVIARSLVGSLYERVWLRHGRDAVKMLAARLRPVLAKLATSAASRSRGGGCPPPS